MTPPSPPRPSAPPPASLPPRAQTGVPKDTIQTNTIPAPPHVDLAHDAVDEAAGKRPRHTTLEGAGPWGEDS